MKQWLGWLLAIVPLFLAGCGALRGPDPAVEPWVRADGPRPAGDSESLLMYFEHVRRLPAPELAKELDDVRLLYAAGRSDSARVRLAMLLTVPGAAFNDDARALEALDPLLKNQNSPLHAIAYIVSTQIQERRRALALQQRVESEQKRGQVLQQKVDEEQKRGNALQQKIDEEQKRGLSLQQKLDALRSLEKSLLQRETDGGARRK